MRAQDRLRFLYGPYHAPALRRGDRAYCHLRGCEVVITGWSAGRIQWPRCRALGSRGGSGLLVDETLAFAVRHESAVAIKHWFGVSTKAVWNWRTALGVRRMDNPGSRRLILAAGKLGARTMAIYGLPDHLCNLISERSRRLNLIRFAHAKPAKRPWTAEELSQLGKVEDAVLAARFGRTEGAVRVMRARHGLPTPTDRRRRMTPSTSHDSQFARLQVLPCVPRCR